ncbi:glycosyltransferase family 2 protein [Candidatus Roizmanbacteria bacterium]|nr:glycosyltransferase family 2 protein [Candidatus Roizmanbacteria bacterium]
MKNLSIIIVNYNTEEFLKRCLLSLGKIPESWEVIVVDNASRDAIKYKVSTIKYKTPIIFIENKENLGFAKANNQGIQKAKGQYILLLNPDTEVTNGTIQTILEFMEKEKKAGVATCLVKLPDGKIDDACHRGFPTPWRAFCHFSGLSSLFPNSLLFNGYHLGYQNMEQTHEVDACMGAFMMIRRSAGDEINWLDEDYFWYGEDIDFCYRIKQTGWSVWFIPSISILHHKGISSGIKEHSKYLSTADEATTKKAQEARFDVMKIFYEKHYKDKYPVLVSYIVNTGITLLKNYLFSITRK